MDVGFYNEDAMDDPDDLMWIEVADDSYYGTFWWHNYMEGIRFRDQVDSSITYEESVAGAWEVATTQYEVLGVVDSGSSCLVLSDYVYDYVIEYLVSLLSYTEYDTTYNWGYLYYCSEIPSL